jgi:hypothetical protein
VRVRFGFAEDEGTHEGDAGGEGQEKDGVDDAIADGLVGLEEELGVFGGEEDGVEDSEEGEEAEDEGYGFCEFEQHASAPCVISLLLFDETNLSLRLLAVQEGFYALQVFFGVDADGVELGGLYVDGDVVFEEAELFEALGLFEKAER